MKLYDPGFERRLWRRVRPAWRADRKRHGAATPGAGRRLNPVFLLILMAFLLFLPFVFMQTAEFELWSPEAYAALAGFTVTGFLVAISAGARPLIENPVELSFLLNTPASSELIGRWSWQRLRGVRFCAGLLVLAIVIGMHVHLGGAWHWKYVPFWLGLAALGAAVAPAVGLLPVDFRVRLLLVGGPAIIGASAIWHWPLLAAYRDFFEHYGAGLQWLHPGGWLVALVPLEGSPWAWRREWLLLIPLLALAESTRYWRRRFFQGLDLSKLIERFEWAPSAPESEAREQESVRGLGEEVPALEAEGRFTQWLTRRLTDRERMLCEICEVKLPSLGRLARWAVQFCAISWASAVLIRFMHWHSGVLVWIALVGACLHFFRALSCAVSPLASALSVNLPIGYGEIRRLEWKLAWPVMILLNPAAVLFSSAVAWVFERSLLDGFTGGLKLMLFGALWHPALVTCRYSSGSGDTKGWRWPTFWVFAHILFAIFGVMTGLVGVCLGGWLGLGMVLGAGIPSYRFYATHRGYWDRRKFDVGIAAES